MEKGIKNKIRLGIFITVGIIILILGIYFVGERQQLFRNTFRVTGIFKDVAGLQAGSAVRFSGINVGAVEKIGIVSDTSVKVEILIDDNARQFIKKDAVASIGSDGLMGNKILIINPGTGGKPMIEDHDNIGTIQPVNMDDIINSLKTTIDNTSNITNDLSKIASNIQSGNGTIGRFLMDKSMAQNIDSAVVNLKQGTAELKVVMTEAKNSFSKNFDSTFVNLREGSVGFKILMEKAKKSWLLWGF
jgi:phospholipid/cholesterol/gamma-HCH transport system substrate-binding protein